MEENWYVESRGWFVLVIAHVAWIVASTASARRHVWNTVLGATTTPPPSVGIGSYVLAGTSKHSAKKVKGRKPPPAYSSSLRVSWLVNIRDAVDRAAMPRSAYRKLYLYLYFYLSALSQQMIVAPSTLTDPQLQSIAQRLAEDHVT